MMSFLGLCFLFYGIYKVMDWSGEPHYKWEEYEVEEKPKPRKVKKQNEVLTIVSKNNKK